MKKIALMIVCVIALAAPVFADDSTDALKVYKEYLTATTEKNLGKVMSLLDETSPDYKMQLKGVAESMLNSGLEYKITSAKLVGKTGDYIVLRVVQENIPPASNTDAKAVEVDALQIFKKGSDGEWKFRNSQILAVEVKE